MSGKHRTGNMKTFRCNCALMMSRIAIAASKVWAMGEGMVSGPLALWSRHSPPSVAVGALGVVDPVPAGDAVNAPSGQSCSGASRID